MPGAIHLIRCDLAEFRGLGFAPAEYQAGLSEWTGHICRVLRADFAMFINVPAAKPEVEAAFAAHEQALIDSDLEQLDGHFRESELVMLARRLARRECILFDAGRAALSLPGRYRAKFARPPLKRQWRPVRH